MPNVFFSTHSRIHNHFQLRRGRFCAKDHLAARAAFGIWRDIAGIATAA
jgi:putative transposase